MTKTEMLAKMDAAMTLNRLRPRSQDSYRGCVRRFLSWCLENPSRLTLPRGERVSSFLSEHAPGWAASSQNQHLCTLVFFHEKALGEPLGKLPRWTSAQRARRLPVWLSDQEARAVLAQLRGDPKLAGSLMYGSGFRLTETFQLRRRDINWKDESITIRDGKGGKDRTSCLPRCLMEDLRAQDARANALWLEDRANNVGPVWMPDDVTRKYPAAGFEPANYWLFPARGLVRDAVKWGKVRHHVNPDTFSKAVVIATRRAGVLKHVKAHVFRHSFATEMLQRGLDIRSLADLLGHASITTTMIYTHCIPNLAGRVRSPLDREPSKVVAFPGREQAKALSAHCRA